MANISVHNLLEELLRPTWVHDSIIKALKHCEKVILKGQL